MNSFRFLSSSAYLSFAALLLLVLAPGSPLEASAYRGCRVEAKILKKQSDWKKGKMTLEIQALSAAFHSGHSTSPDCDFLKEYKGTVEISEIPEDKKALKAGGKITLLHETVINVGGGQMHAFKSWKWLEPAKDD